MELNGHDVTDMDNSSEVIAEVRRMRAADEVRRSILTRYDHGELTAKERDTTMEALDCQIAQEATLAVTNARQIVLSRYVLAPCPMTQ